MNQITIELATSLLSGDYLQDGFSNLSNTKVDDFSYMANELLNYFYDCNVDGSLEYEKLKGRCQLLAYALEDVIGVYRASHSEGS